VAIALTAAIFGPPAAGSPARLTYRLVDSAGPQWYTPAFEQQVMASGTVGVRMPEGATFPGGITEQTLAAALRTGLGAGQWLLTLPGSDGSDGSDTTVGWCTASFLFRYNDRWGLSTAAHCGSVGQRVSAFVVPPPESGASPGVYAIGEIVISHNNGIGGRFCAHRDK
jgi:hypothetical protein